jgi:hypothetical protein
MKGWAWKGAKQTKNSVSVQLVNAEGGDQLAIGDHSEDPDLHPKDTRSNY